MTSPNDGFLSAGESGGTEARTPDVLGGLYFVNADGRAVEGDGYALDFGILAVAPEADHFELA